jgi:hypothetical protein
MWGSQLLWCQGGSSIPYRILDCLHLALTIHLGYYYLVTTFGDVLSFNFIIWSEDVCFGPAQISPHHHFRSQKAQITVNVQFQFFSVVVTADPSSVGYHHSGCPEVRSIVDGKMFTP